MSKHCILAINPGSTSTKIGVLKNDTIICSESVSHPTHHLANFQHIIDQLDYRKKMVCNILADKKIDGSEIDIIVARGGYLKPLHSGIYEVNQKMIDDLSDYKKGEHASNLGGLIANEMMQSCLTAKAYIVDPISVDEFQDVARISGHPLLPRKSLVHGLNQKAIARRFAADSKQNYEDLNLIVIHLGGGISVAAHQKGKMIDSNQGLDGEGPFAPGRSGTLPTGDLVRLCFSGKHSKNEVLKIISGEGGLKALLGTTDCCTIEKRIENGDKKTELIYLAMAYQVAKCIGEQYAVLQCNVDAILFTGGLAYSDYFIDLIRPYVFKMAPIHVYPGEDEIKALLSNGKALLEGEIQAKEYS